MLRPFIVCCLVSISAFEVQAQQEPSLLETWRECLVPPRFGLSVGLTIQYRANQIAFGSRNEEDSEAFLSWIDDRIQANPGNMALWLERYAYLPDKHQDTQRTCETAIKLVREQLVKEPQNCELKIILIELYVALENKAMSSQLAEKLVEDHPDFLPGILKTNLLAYKRGQYKEGLKKALQLTKDHPTNTRVWEHLSSIQMEEMARGLITLQNSFDPNIEMKVDKSLIDALIALQKVGGVQRVIIQQYYSELQHCINQALRANAMARECVGDDSVFMARLLGQQLGCSMFKMMLDDSIRFAQQPILQLLANLEELRIEETLRKQPDHVILQSIVLLYHSTRLTTVLMMTPTGQQITKMKDPLERKRVMKVIYSKEYEALSRFADHLKGQNIQGPMRAMIEHQFGMNAGMEGDYVTAKQHFLTSLELLPDRTISFLGLIGSYRLAGQQVHWNDLPTDVQRKFDTARGHALFAQNLLIYDKPDLAEAAVHIERALKYDPQHVEALMLRACVQALKNQSAASLDEAARYWQAGYDAATKAGTLKNIEAEYYGVAGAIEVLRGKTSQAQVWIDLGLKQSGGNETLKNARRRLNSIQQVGR